MRSWRPHAKIGFVWQFEPGLIHWDWQWMRLPPEAASSGGWIDTNLVPLRRFIATAMDLTMVSATERDRELVADLAAERRCLGKAQMMGISGTAAADKARLLGPRSVRADEWPGH